VATILGESDVSFIRSVNTHPVAILQWIKVGFYRSASCLQMRYKGIYNNDSQYRYHVAKGGNYV